MELFDSYRIVKLVRKKELKRRRLCQVVSFVWYNGFRMVRRIRVKSMEYRGGTEIISGSERKMLFDLGKA